MEWPLIGPFLIILKLMIELLANIGRWGWFVYATLTCFYLKDLDLLDSLIISNLYGWLYRRLDLVDSNYCNFSFSYQDFFQMNKVASYLASFHILYLS
jgi:hypothetical protein